MMMIVHCFSFLLTLASSVLATDGYEDDPYLQYRPPFARSLPVQIMLTGVVLTLTAVLFIHLLFTAQYHWPLAPVNYVLQLSGVTTLLISLIATIHVVLSAALAESVRWPYMLSYISVNVPPLKLDANDGGWSLAERATWLLMTASTSGLIQITHIQFLTLLYPSKLEGRLIFCLLGPLAIVAAVVQLLPISDSLKVNAIASAVRNVCNATLSLLFTAALFVWGFLVNRRQAWRTDGGTAVFGAAALSLAVVGTALNFLYVHKEEEFVWLPTLVWAVLLWQSFLGWWWWVGAGSGLAYEEDEAEESLRQAKRDRRRREAKERKTERKRRARVALRVVAGAFLAPTASPINVSSPTETTQSHLSGPTSYSGSSEDADNPPRRRHRRAHSVQSSGDEEQTISRSTNTNVYSHSTHSRATSLTLTSSIQDTSSRATVPRLIPDVVFRWYISLRTAHSDAARLQAAERVERMRGIGRERDDRAIAGTQSGHARRPGIVWGWNGLGLPWARTGRAERQESGMYLRKFESGAHGDDMHGFEDGDREAADEHGRTRESRQEPQLSGSSPIPHPAAAPTTKPISFWWWGPLGRWRLQDSTTY